VPRTPYVTDKLADVPGPVLAVSDYMRAVPDQIAQWVPGDWRSLGTDGFGFADTRPAARRFFHVDAESIVVAALEALADRGEVKPEAAREAFERYRIDDPTAVAHVRQEGADA
jgi:pyruvate dehydrogenase E1 component